MLSEINCRNEAQKVLQEFYVGAADEIDLETIAKLNKLSIEYGAMDSCDGRIIASPHNGGVIRIKENMNPSRSRFTIAHEIGHYVEFRIMPSQHAA